MNVWLIAAAVLLLGLIPCGAVIVRAPVMDRVVALEMAAIVCILALLLMSEGFQRSGYFEIPLTLAILSFPGSLVFVHFLERWI